jgi:hypothetical protein
MKHFIIIAATMLVAMLFAGTAQAQTGQTQPTLPERQILPTQQASQTQQTAQTQQVRPAQNTTSFEPGKFSFHFGFTMPVYGPEPFAGLNLGIGVLASPKDLLALDLNLGFGGPSKQLGTYAYRTDTGTTHTDGKVLYAYSSTDLLFSYSRLIPIGTKWRFRVGPALGFVVISGRDTYEDSFSGTVEGLPTPQTTTRKAFVGGLLLGFRWNFSPRGSFDIVYMLSGHSNLLFEQRTMTIDGTTLLLDRQEFGNVSNHINLTVGWRIGRSKTRL